MTLPLEILKKAIERGVVVSLWKDRRGQYTCEMSYPRWAGSVCVSSKTLKKAIKQVWKDVRNLDSAD